jgi:hypothetical protein
MVFPANSDEDFDVADLPVWMRQFWSYRQGRTPKDIARYVNSTIVDGILKPRIFGRGEELDKAEARFGEFLVEHRYAPNVLLITGNARIGRRSFARDLLSRLFPQFLSLRIGPVILLNERGEITDLYRRLRDHIDARRSLEELTKSHEEFSRLTDDAKIAEVRASLQHFANLDEAIFVVSAGGLFSDEQTFITWVDDLISQLASYPRIRLILISNRRATDEDLHRHPNLFQWPLSELDPENETVG